jgi:hypothetical protein
LIEAEFDGNRSSKLHPTYKAPGMDRFPHFDEISPSDAGFCCIHPCKGEDYRRCTRTVNQADRRAANQIKARIILLVSPPTELLQDLLTYAELCCCKLSHRKNAKKLGVLQKAAVTWLAELIGPLNAAVREAYLALNLPPRFFEYEPTGQKDNLGSSFLSNLEPREFDEGTLYIIERVTDPGYVKIGYTTIVADDRFAYFESYCGFVPVPIRQFRHIPSVWRVERLVHNELSRYRRQSTTCVDNPTCGSLHSEWFQVDKEHAIEVMVRWSKWMSEASPYDVNGLLKTAWVQLYSDLASVSKLPTSAEAIEHWRQQEKEERLLVDQFASLGLKKTPLMSRAPLMLEA